MRARTGTAQLPLHGGKATYWALDDGHKERILKLPGNGRSNPEITRFKASAR